MKLKMDQLSLEREALGFGVPASSVNTIQWPLRDAVDAGGSVNISG